MKITNLPDDIIRYICEFGCENINGLIDSCKIFYSFKQDFKKLNLSKFYSLRYYEDINFRNLIDNSFPKKNMHLQFNEIQNLDVSIFNGIHTLSLNYCTGITNFNMLGNSHTLNLKGCFGIDDVSALGNVHILKLIGCRKITDVSELGNVYDLDLSYCTGITDVSMLGNVVNLNLMCCLKITDVSALGNVYSLNLSYCNIMDLSALNNVHTLDLTGCTIINNFSGLRNVHK